jgi:hypothetical protein
MQGVVRFEDSRRLGKGYAGMHRPPFARVPHPMDIKPVTSYAVASGEGRIGKRISRS